MNNNYQYSLRFTIDPYNWDLEKEKKLIDFCKKARLDNVVLFINPEELNQGHPTIDNLKQHWLPTISVVSKKLKSEGVSVSLNPWTTLMHSDRGFHVDPQIGFDTMVDYLGNKATSIACPSDPQWIEYIVSVYAEYATLHPKELWIEDDFRHYNHTPIKLACFCNRHMDIYSRKLGQKVNRKEFVEKMLQPGTPTEERKVYLDIARSEMKSIAKQIKDAVSKVSPETRIGLMSSFPEWHAVEGRDWDGLFKSLSGNHKRVSRPHLPAYNEVSPLKYSRDFEKYTRATTELVGSNSDVYPELESYMYSPFVKSKLFTKLQLESTQMVGATGILLNLFDMMGNGIDETYEYADLLSESKDLMDFGAQNRIDVNELDGIKVLFSQDSSYFIETSNGINPEELLPQEYSWMSLMGSLGIACKPQVWKSNDDFKNVTLAFSGQFLNGLSNGQIIKLIENNVVLMDGQSVKILFDRGLASNLINANKLTLKKARTGYQSYEEVGGKIIDGIKNPRITMLQHTGDYYQIEYNNLNDVEIISSAYNAFNEKLGPVMTIVNRQTFILPMNKDSKYGWESQYYSIKERLFKIILDKISNIDYLVDMPGAKLVSSKFQMIISNFTVDNHKQIKIHLGSKKIDSSWKLVYRKKAKVESLAISNDWINNGVLIVPYEIKGLETVFIIKS